MHHHRNPEQSISNLWTHCRSRLSQVFQVYVVRLEIISRNWYERFCDPLYVLIIYCSFTVRSQRYSKENINITVFFIFIVFIMFCPRIYIKIYYFRFSYIFSLLKYKDFKNIIKTYRYSTCTLRFALNRSFHAYHMDFWR